MRTLPLIMSICVAASPLSAVPPQQEPLVQPSHLTYLGAFRLPPGASPDFSYSSSGFAYNPANNSLFINTHINLQHTAEINIPTLSTNLGALATASIRQNPADITEGNLKRVLPGGVAEPTQVIMGGLLVHNNKLIGTSYIYYDANHEAGLSHFSHSMTVGQTGTFQGMYKVGTLNAGYYAGFMASVPPQWQPLLGGPIITGQGGIPIITRASWGPAAFAIDPGQLGVSNPVPAIPLLYYDSAHPTLGTWDNRTVAGNDYNMATQIQAVAFPVGTRSVLYFGRQGLGVPCYGDGGTSAPPGSPSWCYDPDNSYKGNHAYPYKYWVWAYDANDLYAVKTGQKHPWDPTPYARWELPLPTQIPGRNIQGVAYDAASQKLYVAQFGGGSALPNASPYDWTPVIHVFQVSNAGPPTPTSCDLNQDGSVNQADVLLAKDMATTLTSCTADINQDGRCNAIDVQRVVNAALPGGQCVSP